MLVNSGITTPSSPPTASSHAASEQIFENGLEVAHVGLLSPPSVEPIEATAHVTEDILILEPLEGILFSRAGLVVIPAFGLIGECLIGAA